MWNTLVDLGDPGYDILAAYKAKELLRDLLALARTSPDRAQIARGLYTFYSWCAATDLPELLYWTRAEFSTRAEAESALLRYIDGWYNPRRIQEGLGGLSPDEYEEVWHRQGDPAMIHPEPEPSR